MKPSHIASSLDHDGLLTSSCFQKVPHRFALRLVVVFIVATQPCHVVRQIVFIAALGDEVQVMIGAV